MKLRNILLSFLLVNVLISCSSDYDQDPCVEFFLNAYHMEPYSGEEIKGQFYIQMYEYENNKIVILYSNRADVDGIPIDCNGDVFCPDPIAGDCAGWLQEATLIGIIGIRD